MRKIWKAAGVALALAYAAFVAANFEALKVALALAWATIS